MRPGGLGVLSATSVCAFMATVIECVAIPQAARIIPGLLLVFLLPGFAVVRAVVSARSMDMGERLLASVGLSVVITVCVSVGLDATIGLSQRSAAVALGALTLVACTFAKHRQRREWRGFGERSRLLWWM
jgi:uncharacterized membrane protein